MPKRLRIAAPVFRPTAAPSRAAGVTPPRGRCTISRRRCWRRRAASIPTSWSTTGGCCRIVSRCLRDRTYCPAAACPGLHASTVQNCAVLVHRATLGFGLWALGFGLILPVRRGPYGPTDCLSLGKPGSGAPQLTFGGGGGGLQPWHCPGARPSEYCASPPPVRQRCRSRVDRVPGPDLCPVASHRSLCKNGRAQR